MHTDTAPGTPGTAQDRGDVPAGNRGLARTTGLLYLGLGITGLLGFLVIRSQVYVPDNAEETLARLIDREALTRVCIALELGIVITQALAAVWFFRLFREVDAFAAGCIAAFGLANALIVLTSSAFTATAVQVATDTSGGTATGVTPSGSTAETVQLLYLVSTNLWQVGAIFFGLWLIPMGRCVLGTGSMPRPLGWVLIAGGVGYVVSCFVFYLAPDAEAVVTALVIPATVGEFWIIGYLLARGTGTPGRGAPA